MSFQKMYSERVREKIQTGPGRTKQSFREECDVNNVVAKYKRTGQLPALVKSNPAYGDFASVPSFQEALETVRKAESTFAALPAAVRQECFNDPATFLQRVRDPEWAQKHKLALPPQAKPIDASEPAKGAGKASKKPAATQPGEADDE